MSLNLQTPLCLRHCGLLSGWVTVRMVKDQWRNATTRGLPALSQVGAPSDSKIKNLSLSGGPLPVGSPSLDEQSPIVTPL